VKLILKSDVANLGGAGDVVDVADGYGNNYLVPRGLAMRASKGALADATAMRNSRLKREAKTLGEARELQATLEAAPIRIRARAGEDGTLFGSVGSAAIVDAVREQLGITLDRRRVDLERPIKTLGSHEVGVRVHRELTAGLRVEVTQGM
jgi:large subunit ribosomal protein L9